MLPIAHDVESSVDSQLKQLLMMTDTKVQLLELIYLGRFIHKQRAPPINPTLITTSLSSF
jgi:hypothetical protein